MSANFIASGQGLSTNEWLATVIDNGLEALGQARIFGTTRAEDGAFSWEDAATALAENASNDIPYLRNLSGLFGWGDETLPFPDLAGAAGEISDAVENAGFFSGETAEALAGLAAETLPGGNQLRKTVRGVRAMAAGGKVNGSGENQRLQYPIEDSFGNWVRAAIFGPYAFPEADAFYASGATGLSANQTALWRALEEAGEDRMDTYALIQTVREIQNDDAADSRTKSREIRAAINGSGLSDENKQRLYEGMTGSGESRHDGFTAMRDAGLSWDDITRAHDAYDTFLADETAGAAERQRAFAHWLDGQAWSREQRTAAAEAFQVLEPGSGELPAVYVHARRQGWIRTRRRQWQGRWLC